MDLVRPATDYANAPYVRIVQPHVQPQIAVNPPTLPHGQPPALLHNHQSHSVAVDLPPSSKLQTV